MLELYIQKTSINPDLRLTRIKLVVRMISNIFLYQNLRFIPTFLKLFHLADPNHFFIFCGPPNTVNNEKTTDWLHTNKMHKSLYSCCCLQNRLIWGSVWFMLLTTFFSGFAIQGLILDKASRTSILFRYFGLIFTKLEKPTLHWYVVVKGRTSLSMPS